MGIELQWTAASERLTAQRRANLNLDGETQGGTASFGFAFTTAATKSQRYLLSLLA